MKADALAVVSRSVVRRPGDLTATRQIVLAARQLADDALSEADVKAASRFVKIAVPAARKLKDRKLLAVLQNSSRDLERLETQYDLVQKAVAALERTPDHPEASLVAGSWYCFIGGDWEKGLPWLAGGSDATLSAPKLLLPSIQVNMRAGRFPPAEDNGIRYLLIPVKVKHEEAVAG